MGADLHLTSQVLDDLISDLSSSAASWPQRVQAFETVTVHSPAPIRWRRRYTGSREAGVTD